MDDAAAQVYERLLVLRCQAGDEAALAELIARYSPGIRFFLSKITGRKGAADDLLQETWIDVYLKINRLQHLEAFRPWLFRIARDKAYRELRRLPRQPARFDENLHDTAATAEVTFTADEAESVRAALDQLPDEQRDVLVLRFMEEMTYEEIAAVTGCPLGTVRSRIHYAKLALRATLERTPLRKKNPS